MPVLPGIEPLEHAQGPSQRDEELDWNRGQLASEGRRDPLLTCGQRFRRQLWKQSRWTRAEEL